MKLRKLRVAGGVASLTLLLGACAPEATKEERFYTVAPRVMNQSQVDSVRERVYPAELRSRGITGRTEVGVFVTPASEGTRIRVVNSSGLQDLDSAAVKVVRAMRWSAALNGTKPVGAYIKLAVPFGPQSSAK
jgi:TonB family protein